MQGTKNPTFRPTVWPAEPPAVPPVFVGEPLVAVEPGIYASPHADGGSTPVELPPDFAIREVLDVDMALKSELVEFATRWGPPTGYGGELAFRNPFLSDVAAPHIEAIKEAKARLARDDLVSLAGIDLGLRILRSLARHLLAHLEGEGDEAIIAAWQADAAIHAQENPIDLNFAWFLWDYYINRGLVAFTVHVRTDNPKYPTDLLRRPALLYDACCLQLTHYLVGEASVIRCANERCRRPFTRQRGRAREDYGQHRSRGVRYCSHLCAKAQSERDRRRRRAQEAQSS